MIIEYLDPVWSKITPKTDIELILPCLAFDNERWQQGKFAKEKTKSESYAINRGSGRFLTGLTPRIINYCKNKGITVTIEDSRKEILTPDHDAPSLPGFEFREHQLDATKNIIEYLRGVVKNATGTGKTVLAGAICSIWPSKHILFLCHTLDLLNQAQTAFTKQFKFNNVIALGGGNNRFDWPEEPTIVISTIQTFRNLDLLSHCDWADIIIVDEVHHLINDDCLIAEILKQNMAPIRIGLSAELPKTEKGRMKLEGYIGPVISEFNYANGVDAGILSVPLINLIPVPYSHEIADTKHYKNNGEEKGMYQKGIIENRTRNRLALQEAIKSIENGESCLILTARDTQHGHILSQMAKEIFDMEILFIYGNTEKETRTKLKEALEEKHIKGIITNVIWKEGVDIKSLNHVINIGGEKYPIQVIGRGSRTTADKKTLHFTDFLDPYAWLSHHTVLRLIAYAEQGFLDQRKLYNFIKSNL